MKGVRVRDRSPETSRLASSARPARSVRRCNGRSATLKSDRFREPLIRQIRLAGNCLAEYQCASAKSNPAISAGKMTVSLSRFTAKSARDGGHHDQAGVMRDRLGFSLRRHYVDQFHLEHVPRLPNGCRIIDLGGHKTKKRGDFDIRNYDQEVVCVNLTSEKGADVVANVAELPFADDSFEVAICSELLEHVADPRRVLAEVHRVLEADGQLLVCVPFLYHVHADPHDYGRYTEHYWKQVLNEVGFTEVSIYQQGRFWSVLVDMVREAAYQLAKQQRPRTKLVRSLVKRSIGLAKRTAIKWDSQPEGTQHEVFRRFATGFGIRARKAA